mmetsp:Transcript_19929/g.56450  ORF Transcript_19929/g.56450 Transcript_19929/m.56450 type:complete len:335 (-) Transcript_19929:94-1098(-)
MHRRYGDERGERILVDAVLRALAPHDGLQGGIAAARTKHLGDLLANFFDKLHLLLIVGVVDLVADHDDGDVLVLGVVLLDELEDVDLLICVDSLQSIHHDDGAIEGGPLVGDVLLVDLRRSGLVDAGDVNDNKVGVGAHGNDGRVDVDVEKPLLDLVGGAQLLVVLRDLGKDCTVRLDAVLGDFIARIVPSFVRRFGRGTSVSFRRSSGIIAVVIAIGFGIDDFEVVDSSGGALHGHLAELFAQQGIEDRRLANADITQQSDLDFELVTLHDDDGDRYCVCCNAVMQILSVISQVFLETENFNSTLKTYCRRRGSTISFFLVTQQECAWWSSVT